MIGNSSLLGILLAVSLGACAATSAPPTSTVPPKKTGAAQLNQTKEKSAPKRPPLLRTLPNGRRVLARAALKRLQDAGAQRFIATARVRPSFHRGRFRGWRIVSYRGPGALRFGDVVVRINGKSVERPEQFMQAWQRFAQLDQLEVELLRDGRRATYRWPIADVPPRP